MSNREIIEWLRKKAETMPMPGARKMYEAAAKALEAAQPEHGTNLAEVGTDCISRQAVIDMIDSFNVFESRYDQIKLELMIRELPSAEPQIIRCKDCSHNPKYEWFGCPMSHLSEAQRPETAWCWKAERRTDG